ncbi:hypothetical protein DM02DRAFT_684921 [Periconia macrospinosa]|uniref:Protein kinase domain-containing protein n=1 Tax=Periconia macrospinosa TaxID=97972 RepID=A0A2V1DH44_9PLEO|nr:hypothetical protein DM02DRAFT_684921 [Periconia macrospinosa]
MAELILGAVAFGVATPGVIIAFAECGKHIQKRIQTFNDAPAIVKELDKFGYELHQGKIKINLELAEWANSLDDIDQTIKDSIGAHINKLRAVVIEVEHCLSDMVDKNGQVRRFYFTFIGGRKAQRVVKVLKNWQNDFFNIIALIDMRNRVSRQDVSLPRSKYAPKHCTLLSSHPELFFGAAEVLRNREAQEISVLVERKQLFDANTISDIREIASILASRSLQNASGGGILKCLGYREQGNCAELVFEVPQCEDRPYLLSDAIISDRSKPYGGEYSLDSRYRIARQLCDTVIKVFSLGLVHKSIRTDTILLVIEEEKLDDKKHLDAPYFTSLGSPYLTTWTLLRKATGTTSGPGISGTIEDFYRHPKRQGIQPEQRYNFGHDIYSLGVCLLEIGLWEPFFISNNTTTLSALYKEVAVQQGFVKKIHADQIEQLTWPAIVPKVLLFLAQHVVPQRMGFAFSQLIVACLTCLEGGMGDPECFKKSRPEAATRFNDLISQSFTFTSA